MGTRNGYEKPSSGINFGEWPNGQPRTWAAVSTSYLTDLGRSRSHGAPAWLRVWLLAVGRVEVSGHAPFIRGELARLFAIDTNGELMSAATWLSNEKSLDRAIRTAVKKGLLSPGSGRNCLIVPKENVQQARLGRRKCPQCGGSGAARGGTDALTGGATFTA